MIGNRTRCGVKPHTGQKTEQDQGNRPLVWKTAPHPDVDPVLYPFRKLWLIGAYQHRGGVQFLIHPMVDQFGFLTMGIEVHFLFPTIGVQAHTDHIMSPARRAPSHDQALCNHRITGSSGSQGNHVTAHPVARYISSSLYTTMTNTFLAHPV